MNKINKKKRMFFNHQFNWSLYNDNGFNKHGGSVLNIKHVNLAPSLTLLFKFFVNSKQVIRNVYMFTSYKKFNSIHKKLFKRDKKRLYAQSFFLSLMRRCPTILYLSRIIPKLKFLRFIAKSSGVYINGVKKSFNTHDSYKPLDVVSISIGSVLKRCNRNQVSDDFDVLDKSEIPEFDYVSKSVIKNMIRDLRMCKIVMLQSLLSKLHLRAIHSHLFKVSLFSVNFFWIKSSAYYMCVTNSILKAAVRVYTYMCMNIENSAIAINILSSLITKYFWSVLPSCENQITELRIRGVKKKKTEFFRTALWLYFLTATINFFPVKSEVSASMHLSTYPLES